ncbi:hypothetical protein ETC05_16280 [Geobacillus sp. BMUD]|uniref:DUF6644 family protein n=1 Tax=Geobacillus sp. BMUD TaxID=2508876 RepID=UPI0014928EC9|nr:DUF6644 family protein [Geobacillus sp. BMUD]NNU85303.1 hypothetical protein [Geobacillus sp. BMUD]
MYDFLNSILLLLQDSALGEAARSTPYLYPVLESLHILGIVVLVGPTFAFDLRLLGIGRRQISVTKAARYLLPVAHIGLTIVILTGIPLLSAQATIIADSGAAPWKLGLLTLAAINIAVFHNGVYRRVNAWNDAAVAPIAARFAAVVSLIVWTGVIFAGRLLAYT